MFENNSSLSCEFSKKTKQNGVNDTIFFSSHAVDLMTPNNKSSTKLLTIYIDIPSSVIAQCSVFFKRAQKVFDLMFLDK